MEIVDKILNKIRSKDSLSDRGYALFHYDRDIKQKTLLGGLGSLSIQFCVAYIAIEKGLKMFTRNGPDLLSVHNKMKSEDSSKLTLANIIQPLF